MKKQSIILAGLAGVAVIAAVLWFVLPAPIPDTAAPRSNDAAKASQVPTAPIVVAPRPAETAPAPWTSSNPTLSPADKTSVGGLDAAAREKQMHELEQMRDELSRSMRDGKADPRQVDAALARIQQITGSSTVAGVNIDAVRNNLKKAEEMQVIAAEMEREAKKPGIPDTKKIGAYLVQLQKLLAQLRTDVSTVPVPAAMVKAK